MKLKLLKPFRLLLCIVFVATIVAGSSFSPQNQKASAATTQELLNQATALQKEIEATNAAANALAAEADSLRKKIGEFDLEISHVDLEIQLISIRVEELGIRLVQTQTELDRQKELLRTSLRALYKKGDASSFELLVGSQSFSQFINEQDYLERLKEGIQISTEKVIALKQEITTQKEEQQKLLEEQQAARNVLNGMRAERASLLQRTEGEEAKYRAISEAQEAELRKAEEALSALLATGTFVSLGPVSKGDVIGRVGSTGYSTGPHLHLEARRPNGSTMNPAEFLGGEWMYPVEPVEVTQNYGENNGFFYGAHTGIDFGGTGKPVRAVASGNVIVRGCSQDQQFLGYSPGYGYVVVIQHFNGHFSVYAHMTPPAGGFDHCNYSYL